ncbi:MAG: hypothetical protein HOV81_09655 [Kofleriaceae bacterium]|nr:hypothetical protein [Kofleriaceae bacterium]
MLLLVLSLSSAAVADDERSEHTAVLVGDAGDTIGVVVKFDDKTGWTMAVRAKPGADEKTFELPMPKEHGHYLAYVTPGRKAIAFVETTGGRTDKHLAASAKDTIAWVWSPDGKLVRTWTYGDVLTDKEIATPRRSISHFWWTEAHDVTAKGLEIEVLATKRKVILAADASKFR